ncbi:TnsA endonuclease N-terminal domain-containing protein [Solibacillus silvestris]
MAKRKSSWTKEKITRYLNEGRGQGELSEYIPWLKVQDFSSRGNVTRLQGWKTNRKHEFFSNLERNYFFLLEWADEILDIREQFPLDWEVTSKIAEEKGISHSIDETTGTLIPMTTDFLLTIMKNGSKIYLARTIKPSIELENPRVIEKFEIEREYWERKGVSWAIITEKELPTDMVNNIQWLHKFFKHESDEDKLLSLEFFEKLKQTEYTADYKINDFCNKFDEDYNLEIGTALSYFKYFTARKKISLNMSGKFDIRKFKVSELTFTEKGGDKIDSISG